MPQHKSNKGLWICLSLLAVAVIALTAAVIILFCKLEKTSVKEEVHPQCSERQQNRDRDYDDYSHDDNGRYGEAELEEEVLRQLDKAAKKAAKEDTLYRVVTKEIVDRLEHLQREIENGNNVFISNEKVDYNRGYGDWLPRRDSNIEL